MESDIKISLFIAKQIAPRSANYSQTIKEWFLKNPNYEPITKIEGL
jgi:hypothetical protein